MMNVIADTKEHLGKDYDKKYGLNKAEDKAEE